MGRLIVISTLLMMSFSGARGQEWYCSYSPTELMIDRKMKYAALQAERTRLLKDIDQKFAEQMDAEQKRIKKHHDAGMAAMDAEQLALNGNQFEKFYTMPRIWAGRNRVRSDTLAAYAKVRLDLRTKRFQQISKLNVRVSLKYSGIYYEYHNAISVMSAKPQPRPECYPQIYGNLGIRG